MNFGTLLSGIGGFLTGGPIGAGLGIASSIYSDRQQSNSSRSTAPLATNAYLQAFQAAAGGGQSSSGGSGTAANLTRTTQSANQLGGSTTPGSAGEISQGLQGSYQGYLYRALTGGAGLPAGVLQSALTNGLSTINRQAQQGASMVQSTLGRRGVLHSGITGTALADVERGRLSSIAGLQGQLTEADWAARQQAQSQAAGLYGNQVSQVNAARLAQPSTADYLAQLAGAYTQYRYGTQANTGMAGILAGLLQQQQQPVGAVAPVAAPPVPGVAQQGTPYRWYQGNGVWGGSA